ncbi:MAG: LptA/OstA family protein [Candidatus Binataceae bacterium]
MLTAGLGMAPIAAALALLLASAPAARGQDADAEGRIGDTIRSGAATASPGGAGVGGSPAINPLEDEGDSIRVVPDLGPASSTSAAAPASEVAGAPAEPSAPEPARASEAVAAAPVPSEPIELAPPARASGPLPLTTEAASPSPSASAETSQTTAPPGAPAAAQHAPKGAGAAVASKGPSRGGFAFPGIDLSSGSNPIHIASDKLSLDYENKLITFSGHVRADQATGQITSDSMRVKWGSGFNDVQEMVADGNVRVSQGTRYATGERAALDQTQRTVTLTGNPVVHDGRDQITGRKITVFLDTGRSVVEGARAVIFPRGSNPSDNSSAADDAR